MKYRRIGAKPCGIRGRNKGVHWKQRFEIGNRKICNSLTTAQKDFLVIAKVVTDGR